MIDLLVTVIIFAIVGGLLWWLVSMLPLPEPFPMVIRVCVILICILLLLGVLFGGVQLPALNLRR